MVLIAYEVELVCRVIQVMWSVTDFSSVGAVGKNKTNGIPKVYFENKT